MTDKMRCRFVREGGWEHAIDVAVPLPHVWRVALPVRHTLSYVAPVAADMCDGPVLFVRHEWREKGALSFVYAEESMTRGDIDPHECAALRAARLRIWELEQLCADACKLFANEDQSMSIGILLSGGGGEAMGEYEAVKSKLATVMGAHNIRVRDFALARGQRR